MIYTVTFTRTIEMNSISFEASKNTYDDWGLILKERPEISPPDPKTLYVDIPASDGSLDLTEALIGDVVYNDRNITMTFTVMDDRAQWSSIYSTILNWIQGQYVKIVFDEEPDYYYSGRVKIDEWKSNKRTSTIVLSGIVKPYKTDVAGVNNNWRWDTFNFETGVVREYEDMTLDCSNIRQSITVITGSQKIVPTFTVDTNDGKGVLLLVRKSGLPIQYDTYTLTDGDNRFPQISFRGSKTFEFDPPSGGDGIGTITINFDVGSL